MAPTRADAALAVVVALVLLSGLLSITVPRPIVTTVGVLFVIIGLMGLMPVVRL